MDVKETVGIAIAFLVIMGFVLCMIIFFFSWAGGYLQDYNENKDFERRKQEEERRKREEADRLTKNAHKVRTQYPPPYPKDSVLYSKRTPEAKESVLEITNTKDSILVTETVYAD